jgi:hypothetical protein
VKRKGWVKVNFSRRLVIFSFFLLIILLVGMLFWPFILNEIIRPTSLVIWLLLRLFVLSIDQKYYWGAAIFVIVVFLYRFLLQDQPVVRSEDSPEENATIKTVGYWRTLFTLINQDVQDEKSLKRELIRLLLSLYATKHRTSADFGLYEALRQGEIPLPEHIHAFLFLEEPQETGRSIKKLVHSLEKTLREWKRRLTGQKTAEHYQNIEEVLSFMEKALEMKNDDRKF